MNKLIKCFGFVFTIALATNPVWAKLGIERPDSYLTVINNTPDYLSVDFYTNNYIQVSGTGLLVASNGGKRVISLTYNALVNENTTVLLIIGKGSVGCQLPINAPCGQQDGKCINVMPLSLPDSSSCNLFSLTFTPDGINNTLTINTPGDQNE